MAGTGMHHARIKNLIFDMFHLVASSKTEKAVKKSE